MNNARHNNLTACAAALALAFAATPPVQAQTTTWTGGAYTVNLWPPSVTDHGSDWNTAKNWSSGVPTGSSTVDIDRQSLIARALGLHSVVEVTTQAAAGTVNVGVNFLDSLGQLHINDGGSLTLANSLDIGKNLFSNGIVTVDRHAYIHDEGSLLVGDEGSGTLQVDGRVTTDGTVVLGDNWTGSGTVTVNGRMINHDSLTVGRDGQGILTVDSRGSVRTDGATTIGADAGSRGRATVDGGDLSTSSTLTVGEGGAGALDVLHGGDVRARDTVIAGESGSIGTVTVDGRGSSLDVRHTLTVGNAGDASLTVSHGGQVSARDTVIADGHGSDGSVTVTGRGSELRTGNLTVGDAGNAQLTVGDGGSVDARSVTIADERSSDSSVAVDGRGSRLDVRHTLTVGDEGDATLTVSHGGKVSARDTVIADDRSSDSRVTVTGRGSELNTGNLTAGDDGDATLTVSHGGQVSAWNTVIADDRNSDSRVTVTGRGSELNTRSLTVGNDGDATLAVTNGGSVDAGSATIADDRSSHGSVTVDGRGSRLDVRNTLTVGDEGDATLTVGNGGKVSARDTVIADDRSSDSRVTVTGRGSELNTGNLIVGDDGNAQLAVTNGGSVDAGSATIADDRSSHGSVTVDGRGSRLDVRNTLTVGNEGDASLTVNNGGKVSARNTVIADDRSSDSRVTVTGRGSRLDVRNTLAVGGEGDARLSIDNGGGVSAGSVTIADGGSSRSQVSVSGRGSELAVGSLTVGGQGKAELSVARGGQVAAGTVVIGDAAGSSGQVSVSGPRSSLSVADALTVGNGGSAALDLTGGSTTTVGADGSGTVYVATQAGSTGTINLGADSLDRHHATAAGTLAASQVVFGDGAGTVNFNHTGGYQFDAGFVGNGTVNQVAGTTVFNGDASLFTGQTNVDGGTLVAANALGGDIAVARRGTLVSADGDGTGGTFLGDIDNAGRVQFARSDSATYSGVVSGSGSVQQLGAGTTILTGDNTYTGGTFVKRGTLQLGDGGDTGSILGDVSIGRRGTLAFDRSDTYAFDGTLSGSGTVDQAGPGRTNLTADSSGFSGTSNVNAGTLGVYGSLGGTVNVNSGATVAGNGTVNTLVVNQGGVISPDSLAAVSPSIVGFSANVVPSPGSVYGTLTVNGDLVQNSGSIYSVDLDASGAHDVLNVLGHVTLANGALLNVNAADGSYQLDRTYGILHATEGVTGQYTLTGNTRVSSFYSLIDTSSGDDVTLSVKQVAQFQAVAYTANQSSTAVAAQSLKTTLTGPGDTYNPLFQAVAYLPSDAQARNVFDQLSGEIYASARTDLVEDSSIVRDAANARLLNTLGGAPRSDGQDVQERGNGVEVWTQGVGQWGRLKGNDNAATMRRNSAGILAGADAPLGDDARIGGLVGYTRDTIDLYDRNSSNHTDSYHVGVYAGKRLGRVGLRAGAGYTYSSLDTNRWVGFDGYSDALSSSSSAGLMQLFGEVSYRFDLPRSVALEPYASMAYVNLHTRGFNENGGAAALAADGSTSNVAFSTLGLRGSMAWDIQGRTLTAHGLLGWRHAYGDLTPNSSFAFQGSQSFTTEGVPVTQNAAVVQAGVGTSIDKNLKLDLFYSGQFGSSVRDNGLRVNASYRF